MNYSSLQKLSIIVLVGAVSISCSNESEINQKQNILNDIVSFTPNEISSFEHIDGNYFSHLGYESKVLENGNIVFADRELSNIFVINTEGDLQKKARKGRGPGEVLDAYRLVQNHDGGVTTYDRSNNKMIRFDRDFNLLKEWITQPFEDTFFRYPYELEGGKILYELSSYSFMQNPDEDREKTFLQYFSEKEEYGDRLDVKDKPYALMFTDDKRLAGAGPVPFSFEQLSAYNAKDKTVFIYKTDTRLIAEIDFNFDTLSTIPINLPTEKISEAELDSLKEKLTTKDATSGDFWDRVEEMIPEEKVPADKMLYHDGKFWLKSNLRGNHQKWFVVNMEGQILRAVNLPKESILMHVSDEHLGVRLDDVTFALYENPKPESLN
jgi:hypothetical protein